ncbi:MAG: hypothetical protein EAX86_10925 [Candidatus Heimdallarchaeota archaeon]|nr:hypothetical protein [Candidatus Heimdallarchaeota archaeon]
MIELSLIELEFPEDGTNIILGQSHFIKTVEDLYEAVIESSFGIKFGLAFSEASGPCLIRHAGNDPKLEEVASEMLMKISAGHTFIIYFKNSFPINILKRVQAVSEVVSTFCATANPAQVVIARSEQGGAILGVIDGNSPKGIETELDIQKRKSFLRTIGYKIK